MAKTHMTLSDRVRIQTGLESKESFKDIAKAIGKDCTSVSREVRKHVAVERKGCYGKGFNDCRNKKVCHEVYDGCPSEQCKMLLLPLILHDSSLQVVCQGGM